MFTFFISKEVTKTHFRVCIKDFAGYDGQRSDAAVDYLVIGGDISHSFFISRLPNVPFMMPLKNTLSKN